MAKLILRREDGSETELPLEGKDSVTIGRSPECDLPIDDGQASRRHCSVVRLSSGFEVSDLGSTNGTLLNSQLTKKQALQHGDVIRIGATEIVYSDPDAVGGTAGAAGESQNGLLVYARGDKKGEKIELGEQRTTVGRKERNTIVVDDPVASSFHCEIVRDLNGYTIRDLGSTNGTLVNNEMITEAQLVHGSRVRIGNLRFVFQDPAMAEIDLELAGVDDDESEWANLRELDLSAVRRRNPATIVYSVLFVAILGAGAWLLTNPPQRKGPQGPQSPANNQHEPYSFESLASAFTWESEPPGAMELEISEKRKKSGKQSLELKVRQSGTAYYGPELAAREKRFEVRGSVWAAGGATARLGLQWFGLGVEGWTFGDAVSGGSQDVQFTCSAPPWANAARIGVVVDGAGTVHLDDVVVLPSGAAQSESVEQGEFRFVVTDGTRLDVFFSGAPILGKGRVFARDASGAAGSADGLRLSLEAADVHVTVKIEGDAPVVGLELEDVAGYLTRGGFRAFGYKAADSGETYFQGGFPDEGRVALDEVRKILLGDSGKACSVIAATDEGRIRCEAEVGDDARYWRVLGAPEGGAFAFRMKTDLRGEAALASDRISEALNLHQVGRWGEFLTAAQSALAEFPFASKALRSQLADLIQSVNREYASLEREADLMLKDYDAFKDMASLDRVREILKTLRTKFQIEDGKGPRGERLAAVAVAEAEKRAEAERKRHGDRSKPIMDLAVYVALPGEEHYTAALLLTYVSEYLESSPDAAKARAELAKIKEQKPEAIQVLDDLDVGEK